MSIFDQLRQAVHLCAFVQPPPPRFSRDSPDAIDLAAAVNELENLAAIYHGAGKTYRQRFKGTAPVSQKVIKRLKELV